MTDIKFPLSYEKPGKGLLTCICDADGDPIMIFKNNVPDNVALFMVRCANAHAALYRCLKKATAREKDIGLLQEYQAALQLAEGGK